MSPTTLALGTRLGPFEILSSLGEGGMGEVYRATDTNLKRQVAIKVLPTAVAADADRLARFQREAEVLAALNHPNIAHIFGLEKADGTFALVMELVEGPTLADRIAQGAIPLDEALPIARQIADALEAAHEQGIIHRDLKPANIKVRPDGTVKVLDFGLAKAMDPAGGSSPNAMNSPTLSMHATQAGIILGTAAYMSPEQARGRLVDKRTDVWAFGCVVFEMLSGARPFDGEDAAEIIGAVIHKDIAWDGLPQTTPPTVRRALQKCLEKDLKLRIRDIGDVKLMMGGAFESGAPATLAAVPSPAPTRAKTRALFAVAGVVLAAATGVAAWFLKPSPPKAGPVRFAITPTDPVLGFTSPYRDVVISPDGRSIVSHNGSGTAAQLMIRPVDQLEGTVLRGLTGPVDQFISPDSKWVAFFAASELKKVSMSGGPSITLCRFVGQPLGASWGPDDTIVFATSDRSTGLMSVASGGGEPKALTKADASQSETDHAFPSFLPGGRAVLFTIVPAGGGNENMQVAVLDLKTGQRKTIIRGGGQAEYAESGHIVYAAAGSLRAVRFDSVRLEVLGDPIPVVEQVMTKASSGAAQFSLSRNGTLVYVADTSAGAAVATRTLAWVDRHGKEEPVTAPPRAYVYPRVSPDGTKVALDIRDQENDIWTWDFAHETMTRLTFDPGIDSFPVWTPDGKRLLFASARAGAANIFRQQADGSGTVEQLTKSDSQLSPYSMSPDGTQVVVRDNGSGAGDLMLLRLGTAPVKPEGLVQTPAADANGEISPDGHWLAYQTSESGSNEIYVRPFPNVNGGRWQVSSGGGTRPLWARNGRELFFVSGDARALMSVRVQLTPSFSNGNPAKVLDGQPYLLNPSGNSGRSYDVSRDGQKFLVIKDAPAGHQRSGSAAPPSITVVLNWLEELKAKLPPK